MKKKTMFLILAIFLSFSISLTEAFAGYNHEGNNAGDYDGGHDVGKGEWAVTYDDADDLNNYGYYGLRMSVVDVNGKRIAGTKSVDFLADALYKKRNTYNMKSSKLTRQEYVIEGKASSWKKTTANVYTFNRIYEMCGNKCSRKITGLWGYTNNTSGSAHRFFEQFTAQKYDANVQSFLKKYLNYDVKTQGCNKNHYVTYEPILEVHKAGTSTGKIGTVTELISYSTTYNLKPIFRDLFIPAITIGKPLVGLSKASKSDVVAKLPNETGLAIGVLWVDDAVTCCDYNNPEHFHVVDGSDDQDYKSNDMTSTCCDWAIATYGQEEVTKKYPICGACEVKTNSVQNACGNSESVVLTDVSNKATTNDKFTCLYQGVSGKNASKYDYSARQSVRSKYKVGAIGSKYCEVYCIEDIVGKFPGDYKLPVNVGGTFVWPSINKDYTATVETSRTCKIRFRQQEWLNAFNKGNANTKQELVNALKECSLASSLDKLGYEKYINSLNPSLTISYNNGVKTIGPKTLKLDKKNSTYNKNCNGCNVNTKGLTVDNAVSLLNNIADGLANKVMTVSTNLRYVLPDGLYQYADKKTGDLLEDYKPKAEISASGKRENTKVTDTGYSKLLVSEKAKVGEKYDLSIGYSNLSTVSGKFELKSGMYTCKYTPTNTTVQNKCDINEANHFLTSTSGPNGEDCCEVMENLWGRDSEQYKALVKNVPRCGESTGNSCVYPDDLKNPDVAVKNKCCSMILTEPSYSIDERNSLYQKYCSGEPYCPQDCVNGVCHNSSMTQNYRSCIQQNQKSPGECMAEACYGGNILIYRPISLINNEAFPGAEKQNRIWSNNNWYYYSNWAYRGKKYDRDYYVDTYITNNRGVKEYAIYNMDPMYTIKMDSKTIRTVRSYNKTNSYDDFKLKCNKNGRQCRSDFVKQYATGCGTGNWYDCAGISVDRGD